MKILCISGNFQKSVERFCHHLEAAGAVSGKSDEKGNTIALFHEEALSSLAAPTPNTLKQISPGSFWKVKASDILQANEHQKLWFFADNQSINFLNFWSKIKPEIKFVFIYTPPHLTFLEQLPGILKDARALERLLSDWCDRTKAILNFYTKNKEKSVILSDDEHNVHLKLLPKHWKISLKKTKSPGLETALPPLDLYILNEIIIKHPLVKKLESEAQQYITYAKEAPPAVENIMIENIAFSYFNQNRDALIDAATVFNDEIIKLTADIEKHKVAISHSEKMNAELNNSISDLRDVNNDYLSQLHKEQEAQENLLMNFHQQSENLYITEHRLNNFLTSFPEYWEFESLSLKHINKGNDSEKTLWEIKNVYVKGMLIPEINLETEINNGVAGITILHNSDEQEPLWLNWPESYIATGRLPCIPVKGHAYQDSNFVLSSLKTSDWTAFNELLNNMILILVAPDNRCDINLDPEKLKAGLLQLKEVLAKWPVVVRFDDIDLNDTFKNENYQRIGLSLKNLSIGSKIWPQLDYRLSTVDTSGNFGQNPRLEFLQSTRSAFENWFTEHDLFLGTRLELRFAKPNAMDINVWRSLSEADRLMVTAVISSLPSQIEAIQKSTQLSDLNWNDWNTLGQAVKNILIKNTAAV